MADIMRPLSLRELITRILGEYDRSRSVFGIQEDRFFRKKRGGSWLFMGENAETPLGPAAGPHTQLAQNIAAAYLSGARFIELKTVQIMDTLEIDKPCIDCRDECFNTEWSSEFTVPKAFDEYLKAWFILHLLEELFDLRSGTERSFLFNMSVGYNLEGIKSPKIDSFIESLKDSSSHPLFLEYKAYFSGMIRDECPSRSPRLIEKWNSLSGLEERVSPKICTQLTLSTMHGCPPREIEQIVSYMLTEKKLNTYVKLNPTLLGYDFVREVIEKAGYDHILLSRDSFEHDLSYADAVPMLDRLKTLAQKEGRLFGLKLTNTLGTLNRLDVLPGDEMYMSGRLLYPLSLNVAARLSREFNGELPISFSGGLNRFNMEAVLRTGIGPVTAATDFLKPGGYMRMADLARFIDELDYTQSDRVDVESLEELAAASMGAENGYLEKRKRGYEPVSVPGALPLYDCFVAPCKVACPIGQDIPEYIELTAQGRYEEAAALIYEKNPLPFITGHICAHQCQYKCTRRDYESPVEIREIKKIALEKGFEAYKKHLAVPARRDAPRTAVIGAGPAGLAAASYLARKGLPVAIIDENEKAGGVVEHNIPDFRIPREAIEKDVQFVKDLGVEIRLGEKFAFDLDRLYAEGFESILLAVGADKIRPFPIEGDQSRLMASFKFINAFNLNRDGVQLGKHVVVVGGGDTAMDSARAALKVKGVESVTLVYRRSERQMPATEEEYDECREEDISFRWLRNPEKLNGDGTVTLRVMELGPPDASGRRSPVATERTETLPCDTLIPSIGETVDTEEMSLAGLTLNGRNRIETSLAHETSKKGVFLIGDGRTGPSTIVGAMADARKATDQILKRAGISPDEVSQTLQADDKTQKGLSARKGVLMEPLERKKPYGIEEFARKEAERCLKCHQICQKCVDVCPNRANAAIPVEGMANVHQIIHLDAYCNECGNCATFCPWEGKPYTDKMTVFSREEDFQNSGNSGFYTDLNRILIRHGDEIYQGQVDAEGSLGGHVPADDTLKKVIATIFRNHAYLLGPVED